MASGLNICMNYRVKYDFDGKQGRDYVEMELAAVYFSDLNNYGINV